MQELGHTNYQVETGGDNALRFLGLDPAPADPLSEVELAEAKAKSEADGGTGAGNVMCARFSFVSSKLR